MTDTPAQAAARAWLHSYGINTERYLHDGGDHPAMRSLPAAFEAFAAMQWKRYRPGDVIEQFDAPVAAVGLDKRGRMTHSQFLNPGDLFCYLPPLERIVAAVRAELPPDAGRGFDGAHDLGVRRP